MASLATVGMVGGGLHEPAGRESGRDAPAQAAAMDRIADAELLAVRGIVQHRYGRHGCALESCSEAARVHPGYPPAHAGRARALAGLGRPDEAIQAFCDAIACDPEFAAAHADYALTATRLGCYEDAVAAYGEAIRLAPDSGDVHAGRAFALAGAGRLDDAMAACERAVRLDPESAMPHAARGRVLAGAGSTSKALAAFERAARLDPGSASAHAGRGLALEALGRADEALAAYERAIGIDEYHELAKAGRSRLTGRPAGGTEPAGGPRGPRRRRARGAIACRAMDPDHVSARSYIEYCLSYAPCGGPGRALNAGTGRSPPLTSKEMSDVRESASSDRVVAMEGSELVGMIGGNGDRRQGEL